FRSPTCSGNRPCAKAEHFIPVFVYCSQRPRKGAVVKTTPINTQRRSFYETHQICHSASDPVPGPHRLRYFYPVRAGAAGLHPHPVPHRRTLPVSNSHRRLQLVGIQPLDRKSTRLNSSHVSISYAVSCLKKEK